MENPGYEVESKEFSSVTSSSDVMTQIPIILYRRRWVILAIFSMISMMNEVIWISFSSVSTVVMNYYKISWSSMNWLSMVFSALYFTVVGAVFILNKFGLKVTIVGGALCNTIAAGLRLAGYQRNGFILVFLGNTVGGIGQSFLIFIPPTLSSVWFGEEERARASSIGMLMNMGGVAVGFLMGCLIIPKSEDYDVAVKHGILYTLIAQFAMCVALLIAALLFIRKMPPTPPTQSQAINIRRKNTKSEIRKQSLSESKENKITIPDKSLEEKLKGTQSTGFFKNLKSLLTNTNFHLMTQCYGIYFMCFTSISTLLNQMTTKHFPGHEKLIGLMGCAAVLCGLVSIMLSGYWIDRTHRYKFVSVAVFLGCSLSMLAFTLVLKFSNNFALTFTCFCVYGFFQYPFLSIGLEYLAELMYPVKESNLSFIGFFLGTCYGVLYINLLGYIVHHQSAELAGYVTAGMYFIGFVCQCLVNGELKRYNVDKEAKERAKSVALSVKSSTGLVQ